MNVPGADPVHHHSTTEDAEDRRKLRGSVLARLRSFLAALVFRGRMERDMVDEWQFHLDARTEDLVASGTPRAEAQARARREFGDQVRWKQWGRRCFRCSVSRRGWGGHSNRERMLQARAPWPFSATRPGNGTSAKARTSSVRC
jgi:hypothetical protein